MTELGIVTANMRENVTGWKDSCMISIVKKKRDEGHQYNVCNTENKSKSRCRDRWTVYRRPDVSYGITRCTLISLSVCKLQEKFVGVCLTLRMLVAV